MYEWMKRVGIDLGGKDYKHVREQMLRISACSLRFLWGGRDENGAALSGWKKDTIIDEGVLLIGQDGDERQSVLWRDRIVLSSTFFEALRERPVPIDLRGRLRSRSGLGKRGHRGAMSAFSKGHPC